MASLRRYLGRPEPADPSGGDGPDLRADVRRLEIRARQAMESGLSGQYQSAFRGLGLEFEEVRDYRPGDDVRTIDWNVTARSGSLHVKRYREERDLTLLLLVDLSASTRFGSGVMTVHDLIAEVAGLFALAAARRDRVGAVLFDDGVRSVIPPRSGWRHGLRVVREVLAARPAGRGTAMAPALRSAGRILHRRGIVVALVDRACPLPRRERHPRGLALPVVDAEGDRRGDVVERLREAPAELPPTVDCVDLDTDRDYLPVVRALLERRERRRAR